MPALSDPKRERFASLVASGKSKTEAYKSAGFNAKFPEQAAWKMANGSQVKSRIEELAGRLSDKIVQRTAEKIALTKEWVIEKLRDNAEEALQVKGGSAVANRALELLGKEIGMFREPEPVVPINLEDLPADTLQRMLEQAEKAAETGKLQ